MLKGTKVFFGMATSVLLAGTVGTSVTLGVQNKNLQKEHDKYVQEQELKNKEAQDKQEELEKANEILSGKYELSQEELESYKTELNKTKALLTEKENAFSALQTQYNAKQTELETTNNALESAKAKITAKEQEIETIQSTLATTQEELTAKEEKLSQVTQELEELHELREMLSNELILKREENEKLQTELDASNAQILELQAKIEELQNAQVKEASEYADLTFTYNETDKTASVKGNNANATSIAVPGKVKNNGETYAITELSSKAFFQYTKLTEVSLSKGLTKIGANAFTNTAITSITLPDTLEEIGSSAFGFSKKLESIEIPASVTLLNADAFESCNSLKQASVVEGNTNYYSSNNCIVKTSTKRLIIATGDNFIIPNEVKVITAGSIVGMTKDTLVIPEGVEIFGFNFSRLESVTTLELPSSLKHLSLNPWNIKSLTIPENVVYFSISNADSLTNISFEKTTGWGKFSSIDMQAYLNALNEIGSEAFEEMFEPMYKDMIFQGQEEFTNEIADDPKTALSQGDIFQIENSSLLEYLKLFTTLTETMEN